MELKVNGKTYPLTPDMQGSMLLHVLRDTLGLKGTRYGCGIGQCGACTVHLNGLAVRSCQIPVSSITGQNIVTIEGLASTGKGKNSSLHPVQQAFIEEQVPQCGFCMSGQIMTAAALLNQNPNPPKSLIRSSMSGNICRCGTYYRIQKAIQRAAQEAV